VLRCLTACLCCLTVSVLSDFAPSDCAPTLSVLSDCVSVYVTVYLRCLTVFLYRLLRLTLSVPSDRVPYGFATVRCLTV
jgi:hypothetical protein